MARSLSRSRLETLLCAIAVALGLWIVSTTIAVILAGHEALPFWDEWERWITYLRDHYSLTWFFEQHNEHRLAVPKLLFAADHLFFRARNWFLLGCTFCLQAVLALILWRFFARFWRPDRSEAAVLAAAVVSCLYSAQQYVNFIWAFQVQFMLVNCAAAGSFLALLKSEEQRRKHGGGALWIAAAVGLAATATYSMANGVLVWPVMLMAAWWWHMPGRRVTAIAAGALLLGAPFFYHWKVSDQTDEPVAPWLRLMRAARFVVTHMGAPVDAVARATGSDTVRVICGGTAGALLLAAAAAGFLYVWRRRDPRDGGQAMLLHVCAFLAVTSCAIAFGRSDISPAYGFSSRYQTTAYLFWLCLLLAGWPLLRRMRKAILYGAICAALAGGVALQQLSKLHVVKEREATFHLHSTAVVTGVFDEEAWGDIYYEAEDALPAAAYLRQHRLGLFAEEWTEWIGRPVEQRFRKDNRPVCRGELQNISRISATQGSGWRAIGWAWDAQSGRAPEFVIFVDGAERVTGIGKTGLPSAPRGAANWLGYIRGDLRTLTVYALESDARSLCAIGGLESSKWPGVQEPRH